MGKPTDRNGSVLPYEHIVWAEGTWGTETSKYPEEEKEKSIPQVAASETGRAQTKRLASWGCRTLYTELQRNEVNEQVWKGRPEKVKAL